MPIIPYLPLMATTISSTKAARMAGVTRQTVADWIRRGYLKARRTSPTGKYRLDKSDVQKYLDSLADVGGSVKSPG